MHTLKLHMFTNTTHSSTDEGNNPEIGIEVSVAFLSYSQDSFNSTESVCKY